MGIYRPRDNSRGRSPRLLSQGRYTPITYLQTGRYLIYTMVQPQKCIKVLLHKL